MVFPVVMYGCESWTIKKAEHQRIDAFELWYWWRLLRAPWTTRRSNQSILKEISPGCSLEGLILKLKLQYFGHPMRTVDSFEKTLMLGKTEGGRRRGQQRMRWLDGITNSMRHGFGWTLGVGDRQGGLACYGSRGRKKLDTTEPLNWTDSMKMLCERKFRPGKHKYLSSGTMEAGFGLWMRFPGSLLICPLAWRVCELVYACLIVFPHVLCFYLLYWNRVDLQCCLH